MIEASAPGRATPISPRRRRRAAHVGRRLAAQGFQGAATAARRRRRLLLRVPGSSKGDLTYTYKRPASRSARRHRGRARPPLEVLDVNSRSIPRRLQSAGRVARERDDRAPPSARGGDRARHARDELSGDALPVTAVSRRGARRQRLRTHGVHAGVHGDRRRLSGARAERRRFRATPAPRPTGRWPRVSRPCSGRWRSSAWSARESFAPEAHVRAQGWTARHRRVPRARADVGFLADAEICAASCPVCRSRSIATSARGGRRWAGQGGVSRRRRSASPYPSSVGLGALDYFRTAAASTESCAAISVRSRRVQPHDDSPSRRRRGSDDQIAAAGWLKPRP